MKRFTLALSLAALAITVAAETYRWTDPGTGKTVISNTPPPPGVQAKTRRATNPAEADSTLPPALRQPVRDFPVTLFVGPSCGVPCTAARNLLGARGIPFTEKTVDSPAAVEELARVSGDKGLPTLLVGRQAITGLTEGAWQSMLDLAGYPQTPPPGYRPPAPAKEPPPAAANGNAPAGNGTAR
jgi:glutaredoxin